LCILKIDVKTLKEKILLSLRDAGAALEQLKEPKNLLFIEEAVQMMVQTFESGKKLIIAGNGGSLCDANHFAEELTGIFRKLRGALPAISLSESGHLTCIANDIGYEKVFSRGVEAFGQGGDIFVGLTTSGNSPSLIYAFEAAKKRGLKTIAFLGRGGGKLKGVADLEMIIDGFNYSDRVQEAHMTAIHILIEMVEEELFYKQPARKILDEILTTLSH
jgi:D-sedoheptulose 7-phosphate isomerase